MSFSDTYVSQRFVERVVSLGSFYLILCIGVALLAKDHLLDQERPSFLSRSWSRVLRWSIAKKIELSLSRLLHVVPLRRWDFLRFVARQVWKKIALHSDVRCRLMYKV